MLGKNEEKDEKYNKSLVLFALEKNHKNRHVKGHVLGRKDKQILTILDTQSYTGDNKIDSLQESSL